MRHRRDVWNISYIGEGCRKLEGGLKQRESFFAHSGELLKHGEIRVSEYTSSNPRFEELRQDQLTAHDGFDFVLIVQARHLP